MAWLSGTQELGNRSAGFLQGSFLISWVPDEKFSEFCTNRHLRFVQDSAALWRRKIPTATAQRFGKARSLGTDRARIRPGVFGW
jgi:hypothetical protein